MAEICKRRRWWEDALLRRVTQERAESLGKAGGEGALERTSLDQTVGYQGCWGVGDCGDSERADAGLTPPLPYLSGRVHTPESG